jgi:hypothetical protein
MVAPISSAHDRQLAQLVRERFVAGMVQGLESVDKAIDELLSSLMNQVATARENQLRRDMWSTYQHSRTVWVSASAKAWRNGTQQLATPATRGRSDILSLELVGDDVVENKILASRMALPVIEKVSAGFDELRVRVQQLEGTSELAAGDILRPDVLVQSLVDQWVESGLDRIALMQVSDVLQRALAEQLTSEYGKANAFLQERGVVPHVDLRARVRRAADAPQGTGGGGGMGESTSRASLSPHSTHGGPASMGAYPQSNASRFGAGDSMAASRSMGGASAPGGMAGSTLAGVMSPLVRIQARAQAMLGQLKTLLRSQVSDFAPTVPQQATPALLQALAVPAVGGVRSGHGSGSAALAVDAAALEDYSPAGLVMVSQAVRQRSTELKQKAATDGEKATIEVVGLMFQSILTEERIPPNVRVWFSRLQVPVLRVALAEPEFLSALDHPARLLIDRMGSCVLGFDASAISGTAMEAEIRRVVQVIEQYPETGKRVFQLVLKEFEKFLSTYLTEKKSTSKAVSVAQQIEQKETLTIQYTIEMRSLLSGMPMREEIRTFLFKTWAEVLAVANLRDGAKDPLTLALKKTATDLVWSASAKPNRADRTKVIQGLPALLQRLRQGLTLLGVAGPEQDIHIKIISDTLADAFLSKTEAIPQARIDAMAERLGSLEEFVLDEATGDLPLDPGSIEMMLGMDAASITVVVDGDAKPSPEMLAWAHGLQTGNWFVLDHNGQVKPVQFAWRSARKQLFLFAAMDGGCYLIQVRRLGAYLQSGLLRPQEEEALTQRATREALVKIDANPERLLH